MVKIASYGCDQKGDEGEEVIHKEVGTVTTRNETSCASSVTMEDEMKIIVHQLESLGSDDDCIGNLHSSESLDKSSESDDDKSEADDVVHAPLESLGSDDDGIGNLLSSESLDKSRSDDNKSEADDVVHAPVIARGLGRQNSLPRHLGDVSFRKRRLTRRASISEMRCNWTKLEQDQYISWEQFKTGYRSKAKLPRRSQFVIKNVILVTS